ncbi:MAG: glutamate-1-semialdehyde 2,1-aminomutase [Candidatus Omnitrophota bacterium]|nr:glutamate-1-semialdehyde 2,1-aminomutase [Candidatus Omnitrophota bacterium]
MDKTKELFNLAKRYLVGGVDSPVRSFSYVGGNPLVIKSAKGSKVFDYNGNNFIDYSLSFGALILGHAHPAVVTAVKKKISAGFSFGTTNKTEIELAQEIINAIPFIKKIRFVNSGTEAVMGALRLARGYTQRDKILKFRHAYHGHADYLLVKSGSGLATLGISASLGVPDDFIKHTLIAPGGDIDYVKNIFRKYGQEIAAVIVEPVGGNYGVIPPDSSFLAGLRKITRNCGSLLIFDEVISGFSFHYGSLAQVLGITPDIICLGKIIGGGLPIGAFGAKEKIMRYLAPLGNVYQASTFAGNPVVMQSGLSTLKILKKFKEDYKRLEKLTNILAESLKKEALLRKISLEISYYGNMFSLKFKEKKQFSGFYKFMLKQGVYFSPSEFEANFISFAHTQKDIAKTIIAAGRGLDKISVVH